jgi:hypothetical protein
MFPLVPGDCLDLKQSIRTTDPDSLAFVFCYGDALCMFKFKTGASSDSLSSINSSCSFSLLDPPHSHTTLTVDNRNLI